MYNHFCRKILVLPVLFQINITYASHGLTPVYQPTVATQSHEPVVQFPSNSLLSSSGCFEHNRQFYVSIPELLQPLKDVKFNTMPSQCSAEERGVQVTLGGNTCFAKIPLYSNYITIHPHETINTDGTKKVRNGEMTLYDNTLSIGSEYMVSQHEDIQVVITPIRAYYTIPSGGIVEIGQMPENYFNATNCGLTKIGGSNGLMSSLTKIDLSNNAVTSWYDIQVNLLTHLPQLKTLILNNNPLFGCCQLNHKQLKKLEASNTNTVSYDLNLPLAETINLSKSQIVRFDTAYLVCADGACIDLRHNLIKEIHDVNVINKRKLQCDLRNNLLTIEDARKVLTPFFKVCSLINPYIYRAVQSIKVGALNFALLSIFSAITNGSLHTCSGARQKNQMLLLGLVPVTLATAGSIKALEKVFGIDTTPRTIICDDGCLYASGTIEPYKANRGTQLLIKQ